jgi:hypothetical protein
LPASVLSRCRIRIGRGGPTWPGRPPGLPKHAANFLEEVEADPASMGVDLPMEKQRQKAGFGGSIGTVGKPQTDLVEVALERCIVGSFNHRQPSRCVVLLRNQTQLLFVFPRRSSQFPDDARVVTVQHSSRRADPSSRPRNRDRAGN